MVKQAPDKLQVLTLSQAFLVNLTAFYTLILSINGYFTFDYDKPLLL